MESVSCEFIESVLQRMARCDIEELSDVAPVTWKSLANQYSKNRVDVEVIILVTKTIAQLIFVSEDREGELLTFEDFLRHPTPMKYLCITRVSMVNSYNDVALPGCPETTLTEFRDRVLPFILKQLVCYELQLRSNGRHFQKLVTDHVKYEPNAVNLWLLHNGAETEEYLKAQINVNANIHTVWLEGNWPQETCALLLKLFVNTSACSIDVKLYRSTIKLDIDFFRAFIDLWRKNPKVIKLLGKTAFPHHHLGSVSTHKSGNFRGDYYCVYDEDEESGLKIWFPDDDNYFEMSTSCYDCMRAL